MSQSQSQTNFLFQRISRVINALNGDRVEDWTTKPIVKDILNLASFFDFVVFSFVPKTLMGCHALGKFSFDWDNDFEWMVFVAGHLIGPFL